MSWRSRSGWASPSTMWCWASARGPCGPTSPTTPADHAPLVAVVPVSLRGPLTTARWATGSRRCSSRWPATGTSRWTPAVGGRSSRAAKAQELAVGYGAMASAVSDAVPPAVARPAVRLGTHLGAVRRLRPGNLVVSNVPGPDFPLYFAGMRLRSVYPLGPVVDGLGLNITVQSYLDSLFVGVQACPSAVPDPDELTDRFAAESTPDPGRRRGHPVGAQAQGPPAGRAHWPQRLPAARRPSPRPGSLGAGRPAGPGAAPAA